MKVTMLKSVNHKITRTFAMNIEEIRASLKEFEGEVLKRQEEIRQEYEGQVGELVGRFKKVGGELMQERRAERARTRALEQENAKMREKMKQIEVIFNS